jgi:WD40 repeat protein
MRSPVLLLLLAFPVFALAGEPGRDRLGDPLPEGATARLGTLRLRQGDEILSLAFSPDGRTLASTATGRDRSVCLWDARTGAERIHLRRSLDETVSFAGFRAIALRNDHGVARLETKNGLDASSPFTCEGSGVAAFTSDARAVATVDGSSVQVEETATGTSVATFAHREDRVRGLVFSPAGDRLALLGRAIEVFAIEPEARLLLTIPATDVDAVAFSPDGGTVAAIGYGKVALTDVTTGKSRGEIAAEKIVCAAFSPDGQTLAISTREPAVVLVEVPSGKPRFRLAGIAFTVGALAFSPDGTRLATGDREGAITIHDTASGEERPRLARQKARILSLAWSPDGKTIAASSLDRRLHLWDPVAAIESRSFAPGTDLGSVAFSPDGKTIACGSVLLDTATGSATVRATSAVEASAFQPGTNLVASGGRDGFVRFVAPGGAEELALEQGSMVTALAFSRDGDRLAVSGLDRQVRLFDPRKKKLVATFPATERPVEALAFSPDAGTLATVGADHVVRLVDAATGEARGALGEGGLTSVAFAPDGATIACGGSDGSVSVFAASSGDLVRRFAGHEGRVTGVAFSPDGTRLASASADTTILVWRVSP